MLATPSSENNLAQRLNAVNMRISSAIAQAGRNPASVQLLAVSKTQDAATVACAQALGQQHFGENYLDEALGKINALPKTIIWHYIGHVQSNKTRDIAAHFSWLHTLERLKIAQRLSLQRSPELPPLQCLIQINISREPQKSGIAAEELLALAAAVHALPRLQLRGLMAIPAAAQTAQALAADFAQMQQLLQQLQTIYPQADTLSMGMSADLEHAIQHGATMVRIGTDIFGARPPHSNT